MEIEKPMFVRKEQRETMKQQLLEEVREEELKRRREKQLKEDCREMVLKANTLVEDDQLSDQE